LKPETGVSKPDPSHFSEVTGQTQTVVILSFTAIIAPVIEIIGAISIAIKNDVTLTRDVNPAARAN
jgi:hypothetical protein